MTATDPMNPALPATSDLKKPRTRLHWGLALGWLAFITFIIICADEGALKPVYSFIAAHPGSDKLGHFLLIGGMAFLLNIALGLREIRWLGIGWLLGSVIVGTIFTLEEISQIWIPTRSFDLLDLAGDFGGILFFGWLAKLIVRRFRQV
jgi:hypothetical protein